MHAFMAMGLTVMAALVVLPASAFARNVGWEEVRRQKLVGDWAGQETPREDLQL